MKAAWIGAAALCAVTLAALLVVAVRIKERKMEARTGRSAEDDGLRIATDRPVQAGHFTLEWSDGSLAVSDRRGPCAEFPDPAAGETRGWQELRLKFVDVSPGGVRVRASYLAGAPCLGPGRYRIRREGLTVRLATGSNVQVVALEEDAAVVRIGEEDVRIGVGASAPVPGGTVAVERAGEGPLLLVVR